MITYQIVSPSDIQDHLLDGFVRHQETHQVKYLKDGVLETMDLYFVEEWDQQKLDSIVADMRLTHHISIIVYDEHRVIGFSVLDKNMFDGYMNMPYIHLTDGVRGKGIGKILFQKVCELAKSFGAEKLYISGHASVETQAFYKSVGCVLATKINEELYALEPYDIQLEKVL